ncbi:MAG: hypothetical protein PHR06_08875, partial [Candidatus Cloacimonetes bacterium]|nr:hypothetical protein [Candidatus Cloacimonadota bacterium]
CDLCIKVSDMAKHNKMASASGMCLVYLDCISRNKGDKITIVAAFTDGDTNDLSVGRNAIFYDNKGLDWDATVVKIIENPISIRQAFWSPYRKIASLISKQVEKFASSQDSKVNTASSSGIDNVTKKADGGVNQTKAAPFDIAKFAGIFAAIGLAIGAIGSVLVSILSGFLSLVWWKIPLVILGIILIISCPSMILAWLKLRKRNLAHILDANGWAINAKAIVNIPFGVTLTHLPRIPKDSKLDRRDPFRKKGNPLVMGIFILSLLILIAVLWYCGYFQRFLCF